MSKHDATELCPHCGVVLPEKKINMCGSVVQTVRSRPDLSYAAIATLYEISKMTVIRYAKRAGIKRPHRKRVD